jgi:WD40 repeat protein
VEEPWDRANDSPVRILDAATGKEVLQLTGKGLLVLSVAWSPDGQRLITTDRTSLRVWDARTGREILAFPVSGVHAAFAADGQQIVVDSILYSGFFGFVTWPLLVDARPVSPQQRSAQLLVDWLFDEHVSAQEVLERIRTYPHLNEEVRQAALGIAHSRPENPELLNWEAWQAVRSAGRSVDYYRIYLRRLQNLCRAYPDRGDFLTTLGVAQYRLEKFTSAFEAFSAAEKCLSKSPGSASATCLAYLAMTQQKLGQTEAAQGSLDRLAGKWTPDDESEELLQTVEAVIPDSRKQEVIVKGFTGHLRFLPDDSLLVGTGDGTILHYDREVRTVVGTYSSSLGGAENIAVSSDGTRMSVARKDGSIELLELPSGKSLSTIAVSGFKATSSAFSPDGHRLAVVVSSNFLEDPRGHQNPSDGGLRLYSAKDGRFLFAEKTPTLNAQWQSLDWRNGLIAIQQALIEDNVNRSSTTGVLLWDIAHRTQRHYLHARACQSGIRSTAISPDGKRVAAGLGSGGVLIWNVETGTLCHELWGHSNLTVTLAFSPHGRRLASGSGNSTVRVWDPETGEVVYVFRMVPGISSYVSSLSFDSTGKRLACGMAGGKIVIWKVRR